MQPSQEMPPFLLTDLIPVTLEAHRYSVDIVDGLAPTVSINVQFRAIDATQWQVVLSGQVDFVDTEKPFDLKVSIAGTFITTTLVEHLDEFASSVGQNTFLVLYPFLREAILELSVRLRLPPLLLPISTGGNFVAIAESPLPVTSTKAEERPTRTRRKKVTPSE